MHTFWIMEQTKEVKEGVFSNKLETLIIIRNHWNLASYGTFKCFIPRSDTKRHILDWNAESPQQKKRTSLSDAVTKER